MDGRAGIGKTAAAVCCYKELLMHGKKCLWFSEVTLTAWADAAEDQTQYLERIKEIARILQAENPDVIFLDDNNLVHYSGDALLEAVYAWCVTQQNKALFITANRMIDFARCFSGENKVFMPHPGYGSLGYFNTIVLKKLQGPVYRRTADIDWSVVSDSARLDLLMRSASACSLATIVREGPFQTFFLQANKAEIEYMPLILDQELVPIRCALTEEPNIIPKEYFNLSEEKKRWVHLDDVAKELLYSYLIGEDGKNRQFISNRNCYVKFFANTDKRIIAIEISKPDGYNCHCFQNLLAVINYAHDQGGKRVIIVIKQETRMSDAEFITAIKDEMPEAERERTSTRLNLLLFNPAFSQALRDPQGTVALRGSARYRSC